MIDFINGYEVFKKYHNTFLNIVFHFVTSILQTYFVIQSIVLFDFKYFLCAVFIPFITDGIGHLCEDNFYQVLELSKNKKGLNSAGVNGVYNFIYKIMRILEYLMNK